MEMYEINAEKRVGLGKGAVRKLKNDGYIPGILYDENQNIPIVLENHELRNIVDKQGDDALVILNLDGNHISARFREVQRDPVNQEILHFDLMPVDNSNFQFRQLH